MAFSLEEFIWVRSAKTHPIFVDIKTDIGSYGADIEAIGWLVRISKSSRYRLAAEVLGFVGAVVAVQWKGDLARMRIASA